MRDRTVAATGPRRRLWEFVYAHYLESLGSYIALEADIQGPIEFPHKPVGVFIAPGARIGSGCVMYQGAGVLQVETAEARLFGAPTVGQRVYFGAGAKLIGAVRVGDDVRLGAGVTVANDVPAGATVVPAKPRVIV